MPELPEVEVTVVALKKKVLGRTFVFVWEENDNSQLKELQGKKIKDIKRYGKNIFFFLEKEIVLFVHLRMTGYFLFFNDKEKEITEIKKKNRFLRLILFLDNGDVLAFSDARKIGHFSVISTKETQERINKLGPDPLLITESDFTGLFKNKKGCIKSLLMDQSFLAGIGNIYASEILFMAGIDPRRKTNLLSENELKKIHYFTVSIMQKAIKLKGDSVSDFRLLDGERGEYQNYHLVYGRKGLLCTKCKEKIERIVIGGRGTYYCPKCQKE